MTLLGEFTLGRADAGQSTLDMSLDEMIASRRSSTPAATPKNAAVKKSVSNTDRVVGTAKAKRQAKLNAKRGISNTSKASSQQIQVEVSKQAAKSAVAAKKNQQEKTKKVVVVQTTGAVKAAERKQRRQVNKAAQKVQAKPPTKKQIQAAVNAMEGAGFVMPQNTQMVISFAPKQQQQQQQNNNKQQQQQVGNNKNNQNRNNKPPPKKNNNNNMETEEQKKSRGRRGRGRSAAA